MGAVGLLGARADELRPSNLKVTTLPRSPVDYKPPTNDGFTFEWGAFDLSSTPEGMMIIRAFPQDRKFVRFPLTYYGEYQDPMRPEFKGDLFFAVVNGKDRYFLFVKQSLLRWLLVRYAQDGSFLDVYEGNHGQR
jgi:hypothetical protein